MSEEADPQQILGMPPSIGIDLPAREAISAQKELIDAQERLNRSIAEANRSAVELNRTQLENAQANAQMQAALTEEERRAQHAREKSAERKQEEVQAKQQDFQNKQLENIQTTFDILFSQTKWAAIMFYVTFWLGVALVISSVVIYVVLRDPANPITLAFLGAGALAMFSFFFRDPAEKIQKTAGKLVQTQAAMRYHILEMAYWDAYLLQKMKSPDTVKEEDLSRAFTSMLAGTRSIMRQIDESLDDKNAAQGDPREDQHVKD